MSGALGNIRGNALLAHAPRTSTNIIALAPTGTSLPNLVIKVNQILKCLKAAGLIHYIDNNVI
jgi:hypothetical protein